MNIKELKQIIKDLPDDMKVGSSGHMGEFLDCYGFVVENVKKSYWSSFDGEDEDILSITLESAGEEPC